MALIDILINIDIEYDVVDVIDSLLSREGDVFCELRNVYVYDLIRIINKINDKYPSKNLLVEKMIIDVITKCDGGAIGDLGNDEYEVIVNFIDKYYRSYECYDSTKRYVVFRNILSYIVKNINTKINVDDAKRCLLVFATALSHISEFNINNISNDIASCVINYMDQLNIDYLNIKELNNLSKTFKSKIFTNKSCYDQQNKQKLERVVDKIIEIGLSVKLSGDWMELLRTITCYADKNSDSFKKYNNETKKRKMIKKKVKKYDDKIQNVVNVTGVIGDVGEQKCGVTKKRNRQVSEGANYGCDIYGNVQKKLHNNEEPQPPKTIFQSTIIKNEITQPNVTLNDEKR